MPEEAAISGLDDASQARVRLLQSGRAVHAPILGIGLQPLDAGLTDIAGLTPADRNFIVGNGTNWVVRNGQLPFPATQSASSDANTLDDYEEGTWTPAFTLTGVAFTTITYSAQEGDYEKIGRLVRVSGHITVNALTVGAASGNLQISGLPFSSSVTPPSSISIGYITGFTTNTPMSGFATGTSINLYHRTAVTSGAVPSTFAVVSATSDIYFSAVYRV